MASASKGRTSAKWTDSNDMVFIELCKTEINGGRTIGGSLSRQGWKNIGDQFNLKTGQNLDKKQLKNRWDQMKREWGLYKKLMHGHTGIGWDHVNNMIEAADQWWEEQIKINSLYKKFRKKNLTIIGHYDDLFRGTVATGSAARASTQRSGVGINLDDNVSLHADQEENDNAEGSGDSDEIQHTQTPTHNASGHTNIFPPFSVQKESSSGSKRKRSNASSIKDRIQSLLNIAITKSSETSSYVPPLGSTVEECMSLLSTLDGMEMYTAFYYFSLLFEKSGNRKIFMAQPDDRARLGWLEFKYTDYQKRN